MIRELQSDMADLVARNPDAVTRLPVTSDMAVIDALRAKLGTRSLLPDGGALIMLVNNTDAKLRHGLDVMLIQWAEGKLARLDPTYFACFNVKLIAAGEQIRVIVDWA